MTLEASTRGYTPLFSRTLKPSGDRRIAKPVVIVSADLNMSTAILVIGYMTFLLRAQDADVDPIFAFIDPNEPEELLIESNAERDAHELQPNENSAQ